MSRLHIRVDADGNYALHQVPLAVVGALAELVRLVSAPPPEASARLFQTVSEDDEANEANEDWERLIHPELRQLFASAVTLVADDLGNARFEDPDDETAWCIPIPEAHASAWISALNQARLILAEVHDFDVDDMESELVPGDERSLALAKVHLFGQIQHGLIEAVMDDQ